MSISKKNSEGYLDPTAYQAMTAVSKAEKYVRKRPFVYICSPYRGDTERNIKNAVRYCRFALEQGRFPIAPHIWLPLFLDDSNSAERALGLETGLWLLSKCTEVWVFGSQISEGMAGEIRTAKKQCKHIKYFQENGGFLNGQ